MTGRWLSGIVGVSFILASILLAGIVAFVSNIVEGHNEVGLTLLLAGPLLVVGILIGLGAFIKSERRR